MSAKKKPVYTRDQLEKSERFRNQRDLIRALLEDGKAYSMREVEEKLELYRKGKVK